MKHLAIDQIIERAERAKSDSDFTYFFSLLIAAEALAKTIVLGIVASIKDDRDRNRYRLESRLVRSDGLGDWGRVLDDALIGSASHLIDSAKDEQTELTKTCKESDWQFEAVSTIRATLRHLEIEAEDGPINLRRWLLLFTTLRNKTRAHGATQPTKAAQAALYLSISINCIYKHFILFRRPWAFISRKLSGSYRISLISGNLADFDKIKENRELHLANGIYIQFGDALCRINLMETDSELKDFYFSNGGFNQKKYELLSYFSDDRINGNSPPYLEPSGTLPPSETEGQNSLSPYRNCFSNIPDLARDYINRPTLEDELKSLLLDENRRPIVTLVGRGGIGKTSLALKVVLEICRESQYGLIVWLSARDVDLQLSGPKLVRPRVLTPDDMAKFYAELVLPQEKVRDKSFKARSFFENELQKCGAGPCLFIFDNFETVQSPIEMFKWIDSFIRLPNKALITTRLREFKGDYPVDVHGMKEPEARQLINQTAAALNASKYLDGKYTAELIRQSEGHPYVIKILLGEVAKERRSANIPRLVAGTDDVLSALFERTYASISPCAQRAFLTLSAWNSLVPRLALELVLFKSTDERHEVETGIESLLQYSMAEAYSTHIDQQEFVSLPLVASVFGKKKLNINPLKAAILADVEILRMFGPSRRDDIQLNLAKRLENFIENIAQRVDSYSIYESFSPIYEALCRTCNHGWLYLASWQMEEDTERGNNKAKEGLRRFLENSPDPGDAAIAWKLLGQACFLTNDELGGVHALIEQAQVSTVPFYELSNTANKLNSILSQHGFEIEKEIKCDLAGKISAMLNARYHEATGEDYSRMAWLALHLNDKATAKAHIRSGLKMDPHNVHLSKLFLRLRM